MICKCGTKIKDNTSVYYQCSVCGCKWKYKGYWQVANIETQEAIQEARALLKNKYER